MPTSATSPQRPDAINKYESLPEPDNYIGGGSSGSVKKVRRVSDGKILACKSVRFDKFQWPRELVQRECDILERLQHPNIIEQIDVEWGTHKAKIYMEYCENGSLQDLIDTHKEQGNYIDEAYAWAIFNQLASALVFCHWGLQVDHQAYTIKQHHRTPAWNPIIHRDIKPANVFIRQSPDGSPAEIKLGDFGLGYVLQSFTAPGTLCGTYPYLAPEIATNGDRPLQWTEHCDIFSLGCTMFTLCALQQPFDFHTEEERHQIPQLPYTFSSDLRRCIASCLSFQPQTRPNAFRLFEKSQQHVVHSETMPSQVPTDRKILDNQRCDMCQSDGTRPCVATTSPGLENEEAIEVEVGRREEQVDMYRIDETLNSTMLPTDTWESQCELKGHRGIILAVTFSPDGVFIASASRDSTVRLWELASGQMRHRLEHDSDVLAVTFSPNCKLIASASDDSEINFWDVATGALRQTFIEACPSHEQPIAFSPDGELFASASGNKVKLCNSEAVGVTRKTLLGHSRQVQAIAFGPRGKTFASGSKDGTIKLWESSSGVALQTLEGHNYGVNAITFSPDGDLIASASQDCTVKLWDSTKNIGIARHTLQGHSNEIPAVTFSPNGKLIASASWDLTVRTWDRATGAARQKLQGHVDSVSGVSFSPNGKIIASAAGSVIKLWNADTGAICQTLEGHSDSIRAFAFSPTGRLIVSASADKTIKIWQRTAAPADQE